MSFKISETLYGRVYTKVDVGWGNFQDLLGSQHRTWIGCEDKNPNLWEVGMKEDVLTDTSTGGGSRR